MASRWADPGRSRSPATRWARSASPRWWCWPGSAIWKGERWARAIWLADYKAGLPFQVAFFRGVWCNVLVCLAVWGAMAGRSVTDKVLAVVPPITAFVAAGLEHSVANLFLIPLGVLTAQAGAVVLGPGGEIVAPAWTGVIRNLVPVTLGNIVGGAGMVALVYHLVNRRRWPDPDRPPGGSRPLDKRPTGG